MDDASAEEIHSSAAARRIGGREPDAAASGPSSAPLSIVAAARELFAAYGYAKTNVGDIAQAVGMSPANLYRHFRNKRAIGQAVIEAYVAEERREVAEALAAAGPSAEARLRAHVTATTMFTIRHVRKAPKLVELAEMIFSDEDGLSFVDAYLRGELDAMAGLIADGVARGEFAPIADVSAAARATHLSVRYFQAPYAITRHGLDDVEADLELSLNLTLAGLRAGAGQ